MIRPCLYNYIIKAQLISEAGNNIDTLKNNSNNAHLIGYSFKVYPLMTWLKAMHLILKRSMRGIIEFI